jgi:hypothetical protein
LFWNPTIGRLASKLRNRNTIYTSLGDSDMGRTLIVTRMSRPNIDMALRDLKDEIVHDSWLLVSFADCGGTENTL